MSLAASLSATSRAFRGGPLMLKTRWLPVWFVPGCGITICAWKIGSPFLIAGRSMTSAVYTSPTAPGGNALCGIFALMCTERDLDLRKFPIRWEGDLET